MVLKDPRAAPPSLHHVEAVTSSVSSSVSAFPLAKCSRAACRLSGSRLSSFASRRAALSFALTHSGVRSCSPDNEALRWSKQRSGDSSMIEGQAQLAVLLDLKALDNAFEHFCHGGLEEGWSERVSLHRAQE